MPPAAILVADERPGNRSLLEMLLSLDGHDVTAVESGRAALEHLKEHTPALAILDANMPEPSGIDVCERIRKVTRLREMPVIVLTSARDEKTRTRAKMAKADLVVNKPLEGKDFRAMVSELLQEGRGEPEA